MFDILSYHFLEKATPFPISILLRMRAIFSSLEWQILGLIEKYAFMALSHHEDSEGFAEKDPRSAVLISDGVAIVVLGVWVDMGLLAGGTKVLGLITGGT